MSRFLRAVADRDNSTLAQIAGHYPDKPTAGVVNPEAEQQVDALFRQLRQVFPAATAINLRTPADEAAAKKQWIAAFAENGITTKEQLSAGMRWARAKDSPFMPSPGEFIGQCKAGTCHAAGLPDTEELYRRVMKYCSERGLYDCPENYPWDSDADYWMVTALYSQMQAGNLTETGLRASCQRQLRSMAERISAGESVPRPRKQIPQMYIPSKPEVAKSHIADIRARFGLRKS